MSSQLAVFEMEHYSKLTEIFVLQLIIFLNSKIIKNMPNKKKCPRLCIKICGRFYQIVSLDFIEPVNFIRL